jgi:hypothetical protein
MSSLDDRVKALLAKPSLEGVSYILRNRELWPEKFKWSFSKECTCAIGLSNKIWCISLSIKNDTYLNDFTNAFYQKIKYQIDCENFLNIFCRSETYNILRITPVHVADAIDAYLEKKVPKT